MMEGFDDTLHNVGSWGFFQYILAAMFFPFNILLGYMVYSPILILFTPPHWCMVPELMNLTREKRKLVGIPIEDGHYSSCRKYQVDWRQVLIVLFKYFST